MSDVCPTSSYLGPALDGKGSRGRSEVRDRRPGEGVTLVAHRLRPTEGARAQG